MTLPPDLLRARLQTGFLGIIAFAVILVLLVQAQFILISLVFAVIIFSLTTDMISLVARLRVPNWLATAIALFLIAMGLLLGATTIVAQVGEVVQTALTIWQGAEGAVAELTRWFGPNVQETATRALRDINLPYMLRQAAGQASGLMSVTVLIILFVGFMFAERLFFPIKIERMTGDAARAAHIRMVIESIRSRINRYLVVKTGVSALTALCVWIVFSVAGIALAGPVALLTFILNFLPSIGSIIATVLAALLVWVQTGDNTLTLIIGAICAGLQFVIGNVLDPMLLGRTLRLSPLGIVLSLAFWGTVWGIPGMFLAVPINVTLMILCAQSEWLRPLAVALSREGLPDHQ